MAAPAVPPWSAAPALPKAGRRCRQPPLREGGRPRQIDERQFQPWRSVSGCGRTLSSDAAPLPEKAMRLQDFKALTFDCYGTLIDWESGILAAFAPWRKRTG